MKSSFTVTWQKSDLWGLLPTVLVRLVDMIEGKCGHSFQPILFYVTREARLSDACKEIWKSIEKL